MNEEFQKIFDPLKRDVRLSELEQAQMRGTLMAFMDEHPARAPGWIRLKANLIGLFTMPRSARRWGSVALASALVIVLGTGTSYAAETSLPGNPLYPIKINVEEPIEGAIVATTPQAKASWQTTLAARRLQEAEELAAQNKLTPSDTQTIQTQLSSETQNFNAAISQLAQSQQNTAAVATAQSDMEASLSAHAQIIAALTASSSASSTRPELAAILSTVDQQALVAMRARVAAEMALQSSASSSVQTAADTDGSIAQAQLQSIRQLIAATRPTGAASTTIEQALSVASDTQATIQVADQSARHGDYRRAFAGFLNALRAEQETQIDVSAAANLDTPIAVPIPVASSTNPDLNATSSATSSLQDVVGD